MQGEPAVIRNRGSRWADLGKVGEHLAVEPVTDSGKVQARIVEGGI